MDSINIKAYTSDSSKIEAIKAVMKALKVKFEVSEEGESPYDPEFVAKIKKGDKEFAEGKGIKMSIAEFKNCVNRTFFRSEKTHYLLAKNWQ